MFQRIRSSGSLSAEVVSNIKEYGRPLAALFSLRPHSFLLRKKGIAAASEEASSIPFPPGRRKLHIRSLFLPFRKPTASLGRLSVDIGKERERPKPGALPAYPSSCRGRRLCRPVGQYDLAEGLRISDVQRAGRTEASAPTNRIHKIPSARHHQDRVRRCKIPNGQIVTQ